MKKSRQLFFSGLLFDRADRRLAERAAPVVEGLDREVQTAPYADRLHPNGILELVEPRSLRILRSVAAVIDSAGSDKTAMSRRIAALTLLRDEVCEGLDVPLQRNTGRVLLESAKELLRSDDDEARLRAAHDLRTALLGNPLFIRRRLKHFRLLEMPERELPVTFDYHVHDANTKGRKSPSYLIMDAWIKGLRKIQVVYYNFVPPNAAAELLRAAGIMGVEVRIGVEFRTLYRGSFVDLIWVPRGFSGAADFLKFLSRHKTEHFTRKCVAAAEYRAETVVKILRDFNASGRRRLEKFYGIDFPAADEREFLDSAPDRRQLSPEYLNEFLGRKLRELLAAELRELERAEDSGRKAADRAVFLRTELEKENAALQFLDLSRWEKPPGDGSKLPEINRLSPEELIAELHKVASGFSMVLNLTGLSLESVIEILYDCRGGVTTLEIYNLKDAAEDSPRCDAEANELRHALNSGNVVKLKEILRTAVGHLRAGVGRNQGVERIEKFRTILRNMPSFLSCYARSPLGVSIGSDSVGRASARLHGMGMAAADTLNRRARTAAVKEGFSRIPVRAEVYEQLSFSPGTGFFRSCRRREWLAADLAADLGGKGNIFSLGGQAPPHPERRSGGPAPIAELWRYLNSKVRIGIKIAVGFAAAFLTFYYARHSTWWVLSYFGAPIWLGITLLRNIVQQLLAGGSWRSSPLLNFNDFISWQRIADSLLYTGLSVPLLEYVVKTLVLARWCGVTTENHPLWVYAGIGAANGLYLTGHNLLRAFPAAAVWGNWLRVPLSIPLAFGINALLAGLLGAAGVPRPEIFLQQWAAVISKFSSDCVGGVVEAAADRARHLAARLAGFRTKLRELGSLVAEVELLTPEKKLGKLLAQHKLLSDIDGIRQNSLLNRFYINSLDMMYMWMYQPQAPPVLAKLLRQAAPEERRAFFAAQQLLTREKPIGKLLLDGALGGNFSLALAFYLRYYRLYLREIERRLPGAPGSEAG